MSSFDPFENKKISEKSKKLYMYNLSKLGGKDFKNLSFLKKTTDILEKLKELKPNTRRSYLIAVVSSLKGDEKMKKIYNIYYPHLVELNKSLKDNTEKTEKVKDNWLTQESVNGKQQELYNKVIPLVKKKKLNEEEYNDLLDLVILSLYTLTPPRRNRDYAEMFVGTSKDKDNWLDKNYFVFNNYKTAGTYKEVKVLIPDELKKILSIFLKFHPYKGTQDFPLLVKYDKSPLNKSTDITHYLNRILGGKVGCSMLRAIYLTDKYSDASKDMKEDAKLMSTSVDTIQNNYIKKD